MTVEPDPARGDGAPEPDIADVLSQMPVEVTIRLARTRLPLAELTSLRAGSVLEFGQQVGEPIDLVVADRVVALGELVAIEDRMGIRILEVAPAVPAGEQPQ